MAGAAPCPGCGVRLPACDGPTHAYLESSPACWAAFGELIAREYSDPEYMRAHRLTVDAYAVQHPGVEQRRTVRSLGAHLIALHLAFDEGAEPDYITRFMGTALHQIHLRWLEPPDPNGLIDVTHPLGATGPDEHLEMVRAWARSVWESWEPHHAQVATWLRAAS